LIKVGPDLSEQREDTGDMKCQIKHLKALYHVAGLSSGVQRGILMQAELKPDLVVLFNADAYGCPWRRTMAYLLSPPRAAPVVLTTYEKYESFLHAVESHQAFFTPKDVTACDDDVYYNFDPEISKPPTGPAPTVTLPLRVYWQHEALPMAHRGALPEGLAGSRLTERHGGNEYWESFGPAGEEHVALAAAEAAAKTEGPEQPTVGVGARSTPARGTEAHADTVPVPRVEEL